MHPCYDYMAAVQQIHIEYLQDIQYWAEERFVISAYVSYLWNYQHNFSQQERAQNEFNIT